MEENQMGTFICFNCKRELNTKYLYKNGICIDCSMNPHKYKAKDNATCSLCGADFDRADAVSNACFSYCKNCAEKHFISEHSNNSKANNIKVLFIKEEIPYECTISVCIETVSGKPCIEYNRCVSRGVAIFPEITYNEISFEQLKDIAKNISEEVYEQYKDVNETNWAEYIYRQYTESFLRYPHAKRTKFMKLLFKTTRLNFFENWHLTMLVHVEISIVHAFSYQCGILNLICKF